MSNTMSFYRPRDKESSNESLHGSDHVLLPEKPTADVKKNQYPLPLTNRQMELTNAELMVLERLAKRKGYSYIKQEEAPTTLPSTVHAYYNSEWHAIKKKQQEQSQMAALSRANEKLTNTAIPEHLIPSYMNMVLNGKSSTPPPKPNDKLIQKMEKEKQLLLAIEQEKQYVAMQEQHRLAEEEKKRKEKIALQKKKHEAAQEIKRREAHALEEQKKRNKEAALQNQQLQIEKMKNGEPISKQIDEQLARRVKEQPQLPKKPAPVITAEELERVKREKGEREIAIRLAKQKTEQQHKDEIAIRIAKQKAEEKYQREQIERNDELKRKEELERKKKKEEDDEMRKQEAYLLALQSTPQMKEAKRKSDLASVELDNIFKKEAELYETRTEFPFIYIILLCFNESVILPSTIAHYRARFPSCEFIIYDNESTDDSVTIAKELGCHVISWSSNQINDEALKIKIRNHCWRHINEGWIIMADMDEWIYITEEELIQEEEYGTTILSIEGMEMVGESKTLDLSDIYLSHIARYIPFKDESKNLCFFRSKISSMNFGPGSHKCMPIGTVVFSTTFYQLRHMCNVGLPFLLHKMKQRYARSALNRAHGMSIHYTTDENKIKEKYNKLLLESITL